jgi:hypothetical protein
MAPFLHLILTRFNLRTFGTTAAADDLWLRHRLVLVQRLERLFRSGSAPGSG